MAQLIETVMEGYLGQVHRKVAVIAIEKCREVGIVINLAINAVADTAIIILPRGKCAFALTIAKMTSLIGKPDELHHISLLALQSE